MMLSISATGGPFCKNRGLILVVQHVCRAKGLKRPLALQSGHVMNARVLFVLQ